MSTRFTSSKPLLDRLHLPWIALLGFVTARHVDIEFDYFRICQPLLKSNTQNKINHLFIIIMTGAELAQLVR